MLMVGQKKCRQERDHWTWLHQSLIKADLIELWIQKPEDVENGLKLE